jgi:hypothetical protein
MPQGWNRVPTIGALMHREEFGLRLLTEAADDTAEVEAVLVLTGETPTGWSDAEPPDLRGTLVVLPLPAHHDPRVDTTVRRFGGTGAAGLVFAAEQVEARPPDLADALAASGPHRMACLFAARDPSRLGAAIVNALRDERRTLRSTDDLRELQREATRPDGVRRLLRRLAQRTDANVVLLDRAAEPLHAFPDVPRDVLDEMAADIERVSTGRVQAVATNTATGVAQVQSIGDDSAGGVLVVAAKEPFGPLTRQFIADAARLLELCWRAEDADRRQRRLNLAETHTREAVLHLLLVRNLPAARRVAGALGPPLPERMFVYVLECPAETRPAATTHFRRVLKDRAWVVPCPVYIRHLIVIASGTDDHEGPEVDDELRLYAGRTRDTYVGGSGIVALGDLSAGYVQAFHALAMARGDATRFSRFSPSGDLAALLRPRAQGWARDTLEPLLRYRPGRAQDPDAAELVATLRSWLSFHSGAARQLKIHRNTLAARLRHIEELLGRRLADLEHQSALDLALRILDSRGGGDPMPIDVLLDDPHVRHWADTQISPLRRAPDSLMKTLRVWLENDADLASTASALGISRQGSRKRLSRIEELLGRSLLRGPSARYDLWFAVRVNGS